MTARLAVAGWGIAAVAVAAWLAVVEVLWLPLRVAGVPVPVSVVAAVVGNVLLVAAALRLSGSRAVAVLPAVTWLVVVLAAMVRRPEGDLLVVAGAGVGIVNTVFLLLGVLAAAVSVGQALGSPQPGAARSGSGSGGAR
ncbi:hypothetical protein [Blastococcus xanthinilyticus]|uniref:Uncharacterized protein n=1 Tax=Blastococcus xanthinilyticus TaxID=1564164 RepID=A0A5S5CSH1_9ACTN|nr:hypothetical protein [Blastococcus xanthinilyticus]TYP86787.1 hypothetical protein BD833_10872 [Blastococcus xanthinilyticus]